MLDYYGVSKKYGEFYEWDGGYSLGEKEIFNPRSVIEHLSNQDIEWSFGGKQKHYGKENKITFI